MLVAEPAGHGPDGPAAARGQPRRADPDGQRQPGAGQQQLGGGLGLGRRALVADDLGEQGQRLVVVEHVEVDQPGTGQVGHPAAGRDQHRAGRGAGQQRPDLGGVTRVVEHDEHPAPGQDGPVPGRALIVVGRDVPAVDAEVAQEPGQHVRGRERLRGRAEQVDVQLAVGEAGADPVGRVHGQGRLAQPAGAGDQRDADRAGVVVRAGAGQQVAQVPDLVTRGR